MDFGKQYFFTATIHKWLKLLERDEHKEIVIKEWRHQVQLGNINLYGLVIMPNHYHVIMKFNPPKHPWQTVRDMHKFISKSLIKTMHNEGTFNLDQFRVNHADRTYNIWQRNSYDTELNDLGIVERTLQYIHENPTQDHWRLAEVPEGYRYSSAGFYLKNESEFDFLEHYLD